MPLTVQTQRPGIQIEITFFPWPRIVPGPYFLKRGPSYEKNANEMIYEEISVFGVPALFTDWRIDRASVPIGMKMYEVRHADNDWGSPCQLARGILVNFYGTLLTTETIEIPESGYLDFESEDWIYQGADICTDIVGFLQKYHTK